MSSEKLKIPFQNLRALKVIIIVLKTMTCVKKGLSELALNRPRSSIMEGKSALLVPLFCNLSLGLIVDLVLTIYCCLL